MSSILTVSFDGPVAAAIRAYATASAQDVNAAAVELTTTGVVRRRALADHEVVRLAEGGDSASPRAVKAVQIAKALSEVQPGAGRRIPTDPAARQAATERAKKELERVQARLAKLGAVATMPTVTSAALDKAQAPKGKR